MLRWLRDISLLLTLLLSVAGGGWAASANGGEFSGDIRLGAASYRAEVAGKQTEESSHLYQQYNVQYRRQNPLFNGRAGSYSLLLGFEHTVLDPSLTRAGVVDADAATMTRNKLFYQGNVIVAPGGLPFRLQVWSEDLHRSSFTEAPFTTLPLGTLGSGTYNNLIDFDIFGDINNGTHQVYGATLLIGIRNGSYLGAYRDLLSQLPRLLLDYRQEDVENTSSRFSPSKYRNRDLAFISLNKKDNWLHFRMRDYINYLQPNDNSKETQVLIGTIDHTRKRQWVSFTNWLKVSTDGSYTVNKVADVEIPDRTYAFNLFAAGQRNGRQLSILSSFQRTNDRNGLEQIFDLPIQGSIDLDRNTRISTRLLFNAEKRSALDTLSPLPETSDPLSSSIYDLFFETRAELNRSGQLLYRPRLQAERHTQSGGRESTVLKLGGEVATNNKLTKANSWLTGFDLATAQTVSAESEDSAFYQLDLYGRFDREAGRNWRYGSRAEFSLGSGDAQSVSSGLRVPMLSRGGGTSGYDHLADDYSGEVLLSRLSLYGEHRAAQWGNRLEFVHELRAQAGKSEDRMSVEHALQRDEGQSHFEWRSSAELGDNVTGSGFYADYLQGDTAQSVDTNNSTTKTSWKSKVLYQLSPNRQMKMSYSGDLNGTSGQTYYKLAQELNYSIYTRNGIVRRLAGFNEEFSYEGLTKEDRLGRSSAARLKLSAGYYPTHHYYLIATTEYVLLQPSAAAIYVLTANTGFNFQKLKINLSYAMGNKSKESGESTFLPHVVEQRWGIDIKKTF